MKRRYITGVILLILAGAGFMTWFRTARFADNPLQDELLAAARRGDVRELERLHLAGAGIDDYCTFQRGQCMAARRWWMRSSMNGRLR